MFKLANWVGRLFHSMREAGQSRLGWGGIYRLLGLSVGVIVHGMDDAERKKAYAVAEIKHPGTGSVMERVMKSLCDIDFGSLPVDKVLTALLDKCHEVFGLTYDHSEISEILGSKK